MHNLHYEHKFNFSPHIKMVLKKFYESTNPHLILRIDPIAYHGNDAFWISKTLKAQLSRAIAKKERINLKISRAMLKKSMWKNKKLFEKSPPIPLVITDEPLFERLDSKVNMLRLAEPDIEDPEIREFIVLFIRYNGNILRSMFCYRIKHFSKESYIKCINFLIENNFV